MIPNFEAMSFDELFEIWVATNKYEWPELLGAKPLGFDDLPVVRRMGRCRRDYTYPIFRIVDGLIPYDELEKRLHRGSDSGKDFKQLLEKYCVGVKLKSLEAIQEHFARSQD